VTFILKIHNQEIFIIPWFDNYADQAGQSNIQFRVRIGSYLGRDPYLISGDD
jgi:hypothetical protein